MSLFPSVSISAFFFFFLLFFFPPPLLFHHYTSPVHSRHVSPLTFSPIEVRFPRARSIEASFFCFVQFHSLSLSLHNLFLAKRISFRKIDDSKDRDSYRSIDRSIINFINGHEPVKWTVWSCKNRWWPGCIENYVTVERPRDEEGGGGGRRWICVARPISPSFPSLHLFLFAATKREGVDAYEREKKSHPRSVQSIPLLGGCPLDTTNRYSRFDMDLGGVQPPAKLSSRPRFSLSLSQIRFQGGAN